MNYIYIGKIDVEVIEREFGKLATDELILMIERDEHIRERHTDDYELFHKSVNDVVSAPDIILKDSKNINTVFYVKYIEDTNMNIVVKLALESDESERKNSIITAYQLGEKTLKRMCKKNKILYNRE